MLLARGLEVETRPMQDGPDLWLVQGRSRPEIVSVASAIHLPCPEEPPALSLANALPPLETYVQATTHETQIPFVSTQAQWDQERADFVPRSGWSGSGLWRYEDQLRGGRRTYLWLTEDRVFQVGDQDAIKLLLRPVGDTVASYQSRTRRLLWRKAVPLPTLYARALSLCSGFLPVTEGKDWLAFDNVSQMVAALVCSRLALSRKEVVTE
jgi:hypothetical protein